MKALNWTKLSAVAEIVSSIAILCTLFYLAVQTQLNTESNQSAVRQAMVQSDIALLALNNGAITRNPDDMTEEELLNFAASYIAMARTREFYWAEYQSGLLDEATYMSYILPFIGVTYESERTQAFWESRIELGVFRPGFIEDVETLAAERPFSGPAAPEQYFEESSNELD